MTRPERPPTISIWSFCYAKGQIPRDFIEGAPVGSNQGLLQIPMVYSVIASAGRDRATRRCCWWIRDFRPGAP